MAGWAIGQSPMSMTSCERCARSPARPSGRTANCTRVRQPSPRPARRAALVVISASAVGCRGCRGAGCRGIARQWLDGYRSSRPATRRSCWAMTAALSARWAGSDACCQSQPPQPPGCAFGHGGSTRSGEASRISIASARANRDVTSVTRAMHPLAGQRVPHEQHRQTLGPGNAPPALRDVNGRRPRRSGLPHRPAQHQTPDSPSPGMASAHVRAYLYRGACEAPVTSRTPTQ